MWLTYMYSRFFKFEKALSGIARRSLPFKNLKEMQNGITFVQREFDNYISLKTINFNIFFPQFKMLENSFSELIALEDSYPSEK